MLVPALAPVLPICIPLMRSLLKDGFPEALDVFSSGGRAASSSFELAANRFLPKARSLAAPLSITSSSLSSASFLYVSEVPLLGLGYVRPMLGEVPGFGEEGGPARAEEADNVRSCSGDTFAFGGRGLGAGGGLIILVKFGENADAAKV